MQSYSISSRLLRSTAWQYATASVCSQSEKPLCALKEPTTFPPMPLQEEHISNARLFYLRLEGFVPAILQGGSRLYTEVHEAYIL